MTPETAAWLEKRKEVKNWLLNNQSVKTDDIVALAIKEGYTGRTNNLSSDNNIFVKIIYFLKLKGHTIETHK